MSKSNIKASILIVDDTPENLHVVMEGLKDEAYELRPVLSGHQALLAATNNPPDLILLDVIMPELDGYEVCRMLKSNAKTESIPVIFLTAMDSSDDEEKGFELGAVDYISKPFNMSVVKRRIRVHVELKKAQDQLLQQANELREAYAELETFAYTASHDLKSPINSIRIFTDFVRASLEEKNDTQTLEDIGEIELACDRMIRLIDDLMALAQVKRSKVVLEKTNLSDLARDIDRELRSIYPGRKVVFKTKEHMIAFVDQGLMRIALMNLIQNAWKYSREREITEIHFKFHTENGQRIFSIEDNGTGFDMSKAEELFDAFTRLHGDEHFEGTGIGLAIVKRVIGRHNGRVWAESTPGQGSTFFFTLQEVDNDQALLGSDSV